MIKAFKWFKIFVSHTDYDKIVPDRASSYNDFVKII